jgi:hypothetical protein
LTKSEEDTNISNDNYVDYKVNFGNTFPDFNFTPLLNKERWYELENHDIYFEMANLDGKMKLLDIVEISLSSQYPHIREFIDGKYFISGIEYVFREKKFRTKFRLSRRK